MSQNVSLETAPKVVRDCAKLSRRWTSGKTKAAQLLDLQANLLSRALSNATADKDAAACACAWERLENRLNRMRMRPEPKPVDTEALERRKAKRTAPAAGGFGPSDKPNTG